MIKKVAYTIWAPGYELRIDARDLDEAIMFVRHLQLMQVFLKGEYKLYDLRTDKVVYTLPIP